MTTHGRLGSLNDKTAKKIAKLIL